MSIVLAFGLALFPASACSSSTDAGSALQADPTSEHECTFLPLATVAEISGVRGVAVSAKGRHCEFSEGADEEPFLVVAEVELGDATLASLVSGEPIAASDANGLASDRGGALGAMAVARGEDGVFRADVSPELAGNEGGGAVALEIARAAAGAPTDDLAEGESFCDRLTVAVAETPARVRPISVTTCEVVRPDRTTSVYVTMTVSAGASAADQDAVAAGAEPVGEGWASDARWVSKGDAGTLWVLSGDQQIQVEPVVLGGNDAKEVAISLAQQIVADGGLG